jgi:hypothetical protein
MQAVVAAPGAVVAAWLWWKVRDRGGRRRRRSRAGAAAAGMGRRGPAGSGQGAVGLLFAGTAASVVLGSLAACSRVRLRAR